MAEQKKQTMLNGALILSLAVVIIKIIGVFYKMPLTSLIGGVGRGYFNSAYEIYVPLYLISMSGLPIAVSRMVSENVALQHYNEARTIFKTALRLFTVIGIVGTVILLLISIPYSKYVAGPRNLPAIVAIAPSLFFCCVMSAYRGYYEGLRNMKPTAVSQVFEALTKLVVGLGLAYAIVTLGISQFESGMAALSQALPANGIVPSVTVFGKQVSDLAEAYSVIYPISAAGAILGVTGGTVIGTLYLIIKYRIKGDGFSDTDILNSPPPPASRIIIKRLVAVATPIILSSLVLSITNIIDTVTIQARLAHAIAVNPDIVKSMYASSFADAKMLDGDIVKYLWGVYGSCVDFKNLIPMLIVSLGVSALPALSAAWVINDRKNAKITIETVLRITMLVALPAGIGIGILAEPILTLIYGRGISANIIPIAAPLVAVFGYATALVSVSTPITNMLQAIGRADIPLKSLLLGASVKIICNYFLIGTPKYNINGAPVGTVLCYIIIVGINLYYLLKLSKVKLDMVSVFIKPMVSTALCGITAWSVYSLFIKYLQMNKSPIEIKGVAVALMVSISASAIVFALSILFMKGLVRDDVLALPKGEKISKMLEKYKLLG